MTRKRAWPFEDPKNAIAMTPREVADGQRPILLVTHDLSDAAAPDDPATFDPSLESAVKFFQARHGLGADGIVGPATLRALNVPVRERIGQIRVNLERARWTLHELHGDFVLVDVAGFHVSYFRDGEPVWTSRVVVGRDERETPAKMLWSSSTSAISFRPCVLTLRMALRRFQLSERMSAVKSYSSRASVSPDRTWKPC